MDRETLEIVKKLAEALRAKGLRVEGIVVFGSALRGNLSPDSDIDIAVISPDFEGLDAIERMRIISEARIEAHLLQRAMDAFGYTPEEFREASEGTFLGDEIKVKGTLIPV
ncbi:MAG: nucleotidyltransferase domain-containing protein [candidate division WOR-3 bacterium]